MWEYVSKSTVKNNRQFLFHTLTAGYLKSDLLIKLNSASLMSTFRLPPLNGARNGGSLIVDTQTIIQPPHWINTTQAELPVATSMDVCML